MPSSKSTEISESQSENAESHIFLTVPGTVTDTRFLQSLTAESPMIDMLAGTVNVVDGYEGGYLTNVFFPLS